MASIESFSLQSTDIIGNYNIVRCLGRGWEGEVYLVTDHFSRAKRILKIFSPKKHTETSFQQACRKYEMMGSVAGFLTYYHAGYWASRDTYYVVLEYFEGITLQEHLKRNKFQPTYALDIIEALFRIMQICHKNGLCIGDINPGNIAIGSKASLRIIDFDALMPFSETAIVDDITSINDLYYEMCDTNSVMPSGFQAVMPTLSDIQHHIQECVSSHKIGKVGNGDEARRPLEGTRT